MKIELKQPHDMYTFIPMDANNLNKQDRLEALYLLMFLVKNIDVIIQGKSFADVSKQKIYMNK